MYPKVESRGHLPSYQDKPNARPSLLPPSRPRDRVPRPPTTERAKSFLLLPTIREQLTGSKLLPREANARDRKRETVERGQKETHRHSSAATWASTESPNGCTTALSLQRESHSISGACGIRSHVKAHVVLGNIEHSKFQKPSYISLIYTYKGVYFQFGQLASDKNQNALT